MAQHASIDGQQILVCCHIYDIRQPFPQWVHLCFMQSLIVLTGVQENSNVSAWSCIWRALKHAWLAACVHSARCRKPSRDGLTSWLNMGASTGTREHLTTPDVRSVQSCQLQLVYIPPAVLARQHLDGSIQAWRLRLNGKPIAV